jgi:hypothetical protein
VILQAPDVALDLRADERVHERRGRPFELGGARHDLARERDVDAGQLLRRDLADALLVARMDEREQEDDRDRLDLLKRQARERSPDRVLVERHDDVTLEVEPLGHADAAAPRADRRRGRRRRVPDVLLEAAPELDLVAMAVARDQAGHRAVHLDHRVVGGGRAVHDALGPREELLEGQLLARRETTETDHHPAALVVERARRLVEMERAVGAYQHQVREGTADVDPDAVAALGAAGRLLHLLKRHAAPQAARRDILARRD